MVADYRYYFGSLRSPGVIAEIPLYGVYMDMEMNVGGNFNGSFQLDQSGLFSSTKRNSDMLDATIPGFSFIYVEREGTVIWGGYVWSRTYQSQSKDVQLFGQTFEMYPDNQLIDADIDFTGEQRNVFCQLWNTMQSKPERNLGITIPPATFTTLVTTEVAALATDAKFYGELMSQVADSSTGFDWYIQCSRVGNDYIKNLVIGYPTLGANDGDPIFEYPGPITNYYQTEAMADAGTNFLVTASGDGSNMITGIASDPTLFTQGWPRWDRIIAGKDIGTEAIAQAIANQQLAMRRPPKTTIKATMKAGDQVPDFGSWGLGDTVRVVIKDARNSTALDFPGRIVKWTLNPPMSTQVEEYNLIFQGDASA